MNDNFASECFLGRVEGEDQRVGGEGVQDAGGEEEAGGRLRAPASQAEGTVPAERE